MMQTGMAEWHRTRLKYLVDCNVAVLPETTPSEFRFNYVDVSAVTQGRISEELESFQFADAPSRARRLAEPGDSVISTVRTYLRAIAPVPKFQEPTVFSTGFAVLSPRRAVLVPRFLSYYLQSDPFVDGVVADSVGVSYPAINPSDLLHLGLACPPLGEQYRIADFLDRETAQIDALIEKQTALIERLRERRSVALWQFVSKQSVDREGTWFGCPPEGWVVDKLGRHTRIVNGSTPSRDNMGYWTDGVHPWLNSSFANKDVIREADQFVTDLALAECHLPALEPGTVVVGITGQGKTRGMAAQLEMRATINQHLAAVVPDDRYWDSRYLTLLLRSAYGELRFISDESGSTKGALTCADLHAFTVPRPPLLEQGEIALRVDHEIRSTDELISRTERFIELTRERRAALITAAVTGQLDISSKEAA